MRSNIKIFLVGFAIFLSAAFPLALQSFSINVSKIENNIFGFYPQSIVENGDLNIVDNIPSHMSWIVSTNYNYPDIREWGTALLWLPFYSYARLLDMVKIVPADCIFSNYDAAQAFGTVLFLVLDLFLVALIFRQLDIKASPRLIMWLAFIGTPLSWYTLFEPSGSDIPSNLAISLSLAVFLEALKHPSKFKEWFLVGVVFALSYVTRVHALFYPVIASLYLLLRWKTFGSLKKILLGLVAGFAVITIINFGNLWLKWGELQAPYAVILKNMHEYFPPDFVLDRTLFGPNGFIFISPIYLFSLLGFLTLIPKLRTTSISESAVFNFLLFVGLMLTLISTSFVPYTETLLGGKQFIGQHIILIIGLGIFLSRFQNNKYVRLFIGVFVLWNVLWILRYYQDKDTFGFSYEAYNLTLKRIFPLDFLSWAFVKVYFFSLINLMAWIPFAVVVWIIYKKAKGLESQKLIKISSYIFLIFFLGVSLLNFATNQNNVAALKRKGFFEGKVVGQGMELYIFDDIISGLSRAKKFGKESGYPELVNSFNKFRPAFTEKVAKLILVNPEGFTDRLANNEITDRDEEKTKIVRRSKACDQ